MNPHRSKAALRQLFLEGADTRLVTNWGLRRRNRQRPYEALDVVTMALPPGALYWSLTSRLWIYS